MCSSSVRAHALTFFAKGVWMQTSRRVPSLIGGIALFVGAFIVTSNVWARFRGPNRLLNQDLLIYLNSTAFATALFTGFLLILIANGLRRGKRRAWQITLAILILNLISEFFRFRVHAIQISLTIFLLLILWFSRHQFQAKSDPSYRFRPIFLFSVTFTFFLAAGVILFYARHSQNVLGQPTLSDVLLTVIAGFFWIQGPVILTSDIAEKTIYLTLGVFGIFIILVPLWAFLRRVSSIPTSSDFEKREILSAAEKFDDSDSLTYFATRNDKSVIWTDNKHAGIAYRVQNGVMLASGDPFGEYSLWPEAITHFLAKAREYGWTPAVMGGSERGGKVWVQHAGLSAIEIGDEAIINLKSFTLEGHHMSNLRQTINKARRTGFRCATSIVKDLPISESEELLTIAGKWRGDAIERGFSMSMDRFLGEIDENCVVVRGYQGDELVGFLYFVPWGKVGYSLDRMQRAPGNWPGLTELMILTMVEFCSQKELSYLSLNFAAFRSIIERAEKINAGPILRTLRTLIKFFSGWFQVESLYRFNAKFQPEWNARYILYPSVSDFTSVVWAALKAEKFIAGFGRRVSK